MFLCEAMRAQIRSVVNFLRFFSRISASFFVGNSSTKTSFQGILYHLDIYLRQFLYNSHPVMLLTISGVVLLIISTSLSDRCSKELNAILAILFLK